MARLVGKGKAMELVCTGERIAAADAEKIGLVNKVVPADQLLAAAEEMARKIMSRSPMAVRAAIEAINFGVDMPFEEGQLLEATLVTPAGCRVLPDPIELERAELVEPSQVVDFGKVPIPAMAPPKRGCLNGREKQGCPGAHRSTERRA